MAKEVAYIIGLGWLAGIIVALTWTSPHPLIWVEGMVPGLFISAIGLFPLIMYRDTPSRFKRAQRTAMSAGAIMFAIQFAGQNLV